jgi:small subunit ribosomal protein S8
MANHDPISDMLTRIRNASEKRHERTRIPASKLSRSIANVLQQEGFIATISEEGDGILKELVLELKYSGKHRQPTIRRVQRVSKPGLRIYKNTRQLPKVLGGLGVR